MNKSKQLRLERQAYLSVRTLMANEVQHQREQMLQDLVALGKQVDYELEQEAVVKIQQTI